MKIGIVSSRMEFDGEKEMPAIARNYPLESIVNASGQTAFVAPDGEHVYHVACSEAKALLIVADDRYQVFTHVLGLPAFLDAPTEDENGNVVHWQDVLRDWERDSG